MRFFTGFSAAIALSGLALAGAAVSNLGNLVYIDDAGRDHTLTTTGMDNDAVLSPDGRFILFVRMNQTSAPMEGCSADASESRPAKLMRINVDGTGEAEVLQTAPHDEMEKTLCGFLRGQFNSSGSKFYFDTPAWATSGAVHVLDLKSGRETFFTAGSDIWVITKCAMPEYIDQIVVPQHRYFAFGGSYDWYYLFDENAKEVGVVGEQLDAAHEACEG
jgi:hypothetical protein